VASARAGHRDPAEPPGSPEAKVVLEPTSPLTLTSTFSAPSGLRSRPLAFLDRLLDLGHATAGIPGKLAFPNPHHGPPVASQGTAYVAVTLLVRLQLFSPEGAVSSGMLAMLRTPVPETPINKNGRARCAKDKIRLAQDRLVPAPAGNPMVFEKTQQGQFGVSVALATNV